MLNLKEHFNKYTVKYHHKIMKICEPLFSYYPITDFCRCTVNGEGKMSILATNVAACEEFIARKLFLNHPYYCHPDLLPPGIHIVSDAKLPEGISSVRYQFRINHEVFLVNKTNNGVEIIIFCIWKNDGAQDEFFINEMPLLQQFNTYFKSEMSHVVRSLEDNLGDLVKQKGSLFYKDNPCLQNGLRGKDRMQFLKNIGKDVSHLSNVTLSNREKQILYCCKRGNTARQIALHLHLSRRTVESYLDSLKRKLGCASKYELFDCMENLELIGYPFKPGL
jgi:DNA-binding CsgD family transcriptional regulator